MPFIERFIAQIGVLKTLTATISATTTVIGSPTKELGGTVLVANIASTTSVTAQLGVVRELSASISSDTGVVSLIGTQGDKFVVGSISASSNVTAQLGVVRPLSVSISAQTSVSTILLPGVVGYLTADFAVYPNLGGDGAVYPALGSDIRVRN